MERFIARANVDHYLDLRRVADLSGDWRASIVKLLINEENRFSHDLE